MPEVVRAFTELQQGMVLVDRINRTRPCHILTIEDPIEYVHTHREVAAAASLFPPEITGGD